MTEEEGTTVFTVLAQSLVENREKWSKVPAPWYKVLPGRPAGAQFVQISLFQFSFKSVSTKPWGYLFAMPQRKPKTKQF